ncbi:hypothetical protein [Streptomyces sp. NPDC051561]|uniref:hypothetical protein n=1 Tax=Streptomyces sp. NPDC051561 TaxID=3365658 RepID=UPI0037A55DE8
MKLLRKSWTGVRAGWAEHELSPARGAEFRRLAGLLEDGAYEVAERDARAFAALPGRPWSRGPMTNWVGRIVATTAAVEHGRGSEVRDEVEALIAELRQFGGSVRLFHQMARGTRVDILLQQGHYAQAQPEAEGNLRALNSLARPYPKRALIMQLGALTNLAEALHGQGRHQDAEAIARGNLPRAGKGMAPLLRLVLAHSLNGQARYQEALTEARAVAEQSPEAGVISTGALGIATATALYGLGHHQEALEAARESLSAGERRLHPLHPHIEEATTLVARIAAGERLDPTGDER